MVEYAIIYNMMGRVYFSVFAIDSRPAVYSILQNYSMQMVGQNDLKTRQKLTGNG